MCWGGGTGEEGCRVKRNGVRVQRRREDGLVAWMLNRVLG